MKRLAVFADGATAATDFRVVRQQHQALSEGGLRLWWLTRSPLRSPSCGFDASDWSSHPRLDQSDSNPDCKE